ncbi:nitroreductase family deazaflavin-dependent oxidoreductase [Mycobacterium colombiense]|uniref:nitroreductase family deazaflavin-dependent oxidoreductase n=1 Tax=Mycobacterium colombiense TaxID=339268 RepID=UPI0007E9CC69|nr:nitroreductase family deazaflavin-dependent oxidoreductase [Mycobacterium colombiense]
MSSSFKAKAMKYTARMQVRVFKLTNGRLGSRWRVGAARRNPVPTLLLEHRGRKSGRVFTTPVLYMPDGDRLVVVASQGGLPKNPQWFANLVAEPQTVVHLRGQRDVRVAAQVASPQQRAELWPRLVSLYPDFDKYAAAKDTEIPVVILTPR